MDKEYSIEDKKKILRKIEGIKNQNHIEKIKNIIMNENPELSVTKKSNGILMFFHNLNKSTYKKLDLFFEKLDIEKINTISATYSDNNNISNSESELYDSPKIKLSNSEKKILKKKEYQTQIEQKNNNDIYVSDDDVMYKKNIEK